MKTQCNCHVLFCFLSLTLLAAQVSVCKQSLSPFHSVASLQLGAQLAIPVLTFRGTPQGSPAKDSTTPCTVPSPLRASEGIPTQPRETKGWQALEISLTVMAGNCKISGAMWHPAYLCAKSPMLHAPLLSSPDPASIGKEGGKALHFHSPACAEPLGCNTSYLLPQTELQPELGR